MTGKYGFGVLCAETNGEMKNAIFFEQVNIPLKLFKSGARNKEKRRVNGTVMQESWITLKKNDYSKWFQDRNTWIIFECTLHNTQD